VNVAHEAGLFDWILDGKEQEGDYVLKPEANASLAMCLGQTSPAALHRGVAGGVIGCWDMRPGAGIPFTHKGIDLRPWTLAHFAPTLHAGFVRNAFIGCALLLWGNRVGRGRMRFY
jgi:hypothetical protein